MTREEFKAGFAARLKQARIAAGFKTWGLSETIDVARYTLYAWERPDMGNLPNAWYVRRICEVLHVSMNWLLYGEE